MAKIGDQLDPMELGHRAIDLKKMLKDAGYVVPQSSAGELAKMPAAVQAQAASIEEAQKKYGRDADKTVRFKCPYCGEINSGNPRTDGVDTFLVCGACDTVAEVL
jgi:L-serine deaminase